MRLQNDRSARSAASGLLARRGPRAYLVGLCALSLVACFLPLADHLGYELSELVAIFAGLFGAVPGIAAAREEASRPDPNAPRGLRHALVFSLSALALPLVIILLNGIRRPACDPLGGMVLFVAIAVPSAVLSSMLGYACAAIQPRLAPWFVAAAFIASLVVSLLPVLHGPQIFAFHHLAGMYPGPIYDEAIRATPALWWFRLCTLLYAGACAGVALAVGRSAYALVWLPCLPVAIWLSLQAERLHWKASESLIDAQLGGIVRTEHLVLHYPREKKPLERAMMMQDAEAQFRAVRDFLGAGEGGVHVWLYRSAEEKRRLVGAADTSYTKPWLQQIHTNDEPAPHHILRHELVHALGAAIAGGPWHVPGGLVPQMAFIEGIAVAGDWPAGEFTVHEETRAMKDLGRMPDLAGLFKPGLFYAQSGPVAYTAAGSFIRWLWETRGPAFVRDAYAGKAPLGDLKALAAEHARFLESRPPSARASALAQQRFSAPSIVRKRCAHEVAGLQREALATPGPRSVELWSKCTELEPDDPALLVSLRRAQVALGETAAAAATSERILAHPKLSQPLRALALTDAGDAAWKTGDVPRAAALFAHAAELPQGEAYERSLQVRLRALQGREPAWAAVRKLLTESETGPDVIVGLRDLDLAYPRDGLFAYLLAKQLQNRSAWAESARFAQSALDRPLPGPLFLQEALRMRGIAAWHLGDKVAARIAFEALGRDAPPGRALEAQRWLERL